MQLPCTAQLARHTSEKSWQAKLRETWDNILAAHASAKEYPPHLFRFKLRSTIKHIYETNLPLLRAFLRTFLIRGSVVIIIFTASPLKYFIQQCILQEQKFGVSIFWEEGQPACSKGQPSLWGEKNPQIQRSSGLQLAPSSKDNKNAKECNKRVPNKW